MDLIDVLAACIVAAAGLATYDVMKRRELQRVNDLLVQRIVRTAHYLVASPMVDRRHALELLSYTPEEQ